MQPVSIDLGYGRVKAIGPDGRRHQFAARYAPYEATSWGIGKDVPALRVNDGPPFVAGDAAASLPGARQPLRDGRLGDPESLELLAAALAYAGADGDVALATGLPLSAYAREAPAAKEALQGRALTIARGHTTRRVHIRRVVLRPQGVGAALWLYSEGLLRQRSGLGVVVDVGSRTTDVLTVAFPDLSPIRSLSFSLEVGVGDAVRALQDLAGDYPLPLDLAEQALTVPVTWRGKTLGGEQTAAPILRQLAGRIEDSLLQRLRAEAGRLTAVALVGGGAMALGGSLTLDAPAVKVPAKDAVFANALGYQLAARAALGKGAA